MLRFRINLIGRKQKSDLVATDPVGWSDFLHQAVLMALCGSGCSLVAYGLWLLAEKAAPVLWSAGAVFSGSLVVWYFARHLIAFRRQLRLRLEAWAKGKTLEVVVVGKVFRLLWFRPAWLVSAEGVVRGTRIRFEQGACGTRLGRNLHKGDRALIRYLAHNPKVFVILSPLSK